MGDLAGGIGQSLKWLGERRDGLLLGAGLLYLLGYLNWALYGLVHRVGFIPVLDAQYFAAGIVPAIVIVFFVLMLRLLRAFQMWLTFAPTPRQLASAEFSALVGMGAVAFFLVCAFLKKPTLVLLAVMAMAVCGFLTDILGRNRASRVTHFLLLWLVRIYSVFVFIFWIWYVADGMPRVPTEWGGARPRCIVCDIDSAQLSPETRSNITGVAAGSPGSVVRTKPMNLIFDGSEYLFLTEHEGDPSGGNQVYRLRKDAVKAVFACP